MRLSSSSPPPLARSPGFHFVPSSQCVFQLWLILLVVAAVGCQAFQFPDEVSLDEPPAEQTAPPADEPPPAATSNYPAALESDTWMIRVAPPDSPADDSLPHWRHIALEDLLARPEEDIPHFASWIDHANPVVSANAAIALARRRDAAALPTLVRAVRATELKLPHRQAAAEALGQIDDPAVLTELESLLGQYGDAQGEGRTAYSAELHTTLLAALAQQASPDLAAQLEAAAGSPAADVRAAALELWPTDSEQPLPDKLLELAGDARPAIRAQTLELLARLDHPTATEVSTARLHDNALEVRRAAIAALGQLDDPAGEAPLAALLHNQADVIRGDAAAALVRRGAFSAALPALEDKTSTVRLALAESLALADPQAAQSAAEQLLTDRSGRVAKAVVAALADWPLGMAGPLLLDALQSESFLTRQAAAEQLAARWPPANDFNHAADEATRRTRLAHLRSVWRQTFTVDLPTQAGTTPVEAEPLSDDAQQRVRQLTAQLATTPDAPGPVRELTKLGPGVRPALEQLASDGAAPLPEPIYTQVLPAVDPAFAAVHRLSASDVVERRKASATLSATWLSAPPSDLLLERLATVVTPERDALVWRSIQLGLSNDPRPAAVRLQSAALSHPTAEVRRMACEYFAAHGNPRYVQRLLPVLTDDHPAVVLAGVQALAACGELQNPLPLVRLLASRDKRLRLATAEALTRLEHAAGADALVRLAHDTDATVRREAIAAMGRLKNRRFVADMIRALDDQTGIRRTAIESLTATVGQNLGRAGTPGEAGLDEQVRRWKHWHATTGRKLR